MLKIGGNASTIEQMRTQFGLCNTCVILQNVASNDQIFVFHISALCPTCLLRGMRGQCEAAVGSGVKLEEQCARGMERTCGLQAQDLQKEWV